MPLAFLFRPVERRRCAARRPPGLHSSEGPRRARLGKRQTRTQRVERASGRRAGRRSSRRQACQHAARLPRHEELRLNTHRKRTIALFLIGLTSGLISGLLKRVRLSSTIALADQNSVALFGLGQACNIRPQVRKTASTLGMFYV